MIGLASALALSGGLREAHAAVATQSMVGETFFVDDATPATGTAGVSASCDQSATSTIRFTVSGTNATGPYPGPFSATGSATIGPQTTPFPEPDMFFQSVGTVLSLSETFTIHSTAGTVTGTKFLDPSFTAALLGVCQTSPFGGPVWEVFGAAAYRVSITAPDGSTFSDSGDAAVDVFDKQSPSANPPGFVQGTGLSEFFFSSNGVVASASPATVMLSPAAGTDAVGTAHTVTATVATVTGAPVPGVAVQFTVRGDVNTTGSCTTAGSGQCSFTYPGPMTPGQDDITGCAGLDGTVPRAVPRPRPG